MPPTYKFRSIPALIGLYTKFGSDPFSARQERRLKMTDRCPCSVSPVSAVGSGPALLSCMCPDRTRMSSGRDFFDSLPGAALRFSQAPAGPGHPSPGIPCPCSAYLLEKNDQGHPGSRASRKPPPLPAPEAPRPLAAVRTGGGGRCRALCRRPCREGWIA